MDTDIDVQIARHKAWSRNKVKKPEGFFIQSIVYVKTLVLDIKNAKATLKENIS